VGLRILDGMCSSESEASYRKHENSGALEAIAAAKEKGTARSERC
jgi:hypothetical protein